MDADEGDGPWVGLLGFSQGAKIAASLPFRRQVLIVGKGHNNDNNNNVAVESKGGVSGVD